jgi:Putative zinc-binding metallo-peptidase
MSDLTQWAMKQVHRRFGTVTAASLARAFNRVRRELQDVDLLNDGKYLDRIDCTQSILPAFGGEYGFVFDGGVDWKYRLAGFKPGVIYLPLNPPIEHYVPGGTLLDVIRHEFAHAWAWLDPKFIKQPWFPKAFGARYHDEWIEVPEASRTDFASAYACTAPKEDFAETFMLFLRQRKKLDRYRDRRGLYRKLKAVERAVAVAARDRVMRIRGPR